MAKSASTGFTPKKDVDERDCVYIRAGNSATLTIGDAVRVNDAGHIVLVGVGAAVGGVILGLVDQNHINILGAGVTNNTGASLSGDDTVTTASDNTSRANYVLAKIVVDPAGQVFYENDADGDLAQTQLMTCYDVLAASDQIDQSSTSDTSGQFQLVELNADDASKGLFRIAEPQWLGHVGNATAIIAA